MTNPVVQALSQFHLSRRLRARSSARPLGGASLPTQQQTLKLRVGGSYT